MRRFGKRRTQKIASCKEVSIAGGKETTIMFVCVFVWSRGGERANFIFVVQHKWKLKIHSGMTSGRVLFRVQFFSIRRERFVEKSRKSSRGVEEVFLMRVKPEIFVIEWSAYEGQLW